jgi:16S rRNA (cytidine1402-2'-O)-methyltransferase
LEGHRKPAIKTAAPAKKKAAIYLIPCSLSEGITETIPSYVLDAVKECDAFFVENERTARRFLKSIWREMVIDDYQWVTIHKAEGEVMGQFSGAIKAGKTIGILSEAGCPGVADPGQMLISKAQQLGALVKPLVGPSSILLALMACGLNGQQFRFHGYLPIESTKRRAALLQIDEQVKKTGETHLFIETPYRNDHLLADILKSCKLYTRLCIAADITGPNQSIVTKKIQDWKANTPVLGKTPVIFLLGS